MVLGNFHTDAGPQFAIADGIADGKATTVCVLAEATTGDLTGGQLSFKHNVPLGTDNNHFSKD